MGRSARLRAVATGCRRALAAPGVTDDRAQAGPIR